jgi:hypothetical protein
MLIPVMTVYIPGNVQKGSTGPITCRKYKRVGNPTEHPEHSSDLDILEGLETVLNVSHVLKVCTMSQTSYMTGGPRSARSA